MQVLADWEAGIREVLEQIDIAKFHKYLLLGVANPRVRSVLLDGFRRQSLYYGIRADQIKEIQVQPHADFSQQLAGYKFGMNMELDEKNFIFCSSDFIAYGVLEAWRERGIPVGKYPLVGCFNMEGHGVKPFDEPMVTSINHDKDELVRRSVQLLISSLENNDYCPKISKIPSRLVIRKTAFA